MYFLGDNTVKNVVVVKLMEGSNLTQMSSVLAFSILTSKTVKPFHADLFNF